MSDNGKVSRAEQLLPIPPRDQPEELPPGLGEPSPHRAALHVEERYIPGPENAPDVRVVVYRPKAAEDQQLPVALHFHGGAFCFLSPGAFEAMDADLAVTHNAVVVSVDYRLAPENPFPAGVEDCYASLLWVADNAETLGVNLDNLVVYGASAGGALAAAVAMMARDRNGPSIAYQALMIPVMDDQLQTPSHHAASGIEGFNKENNEGMWLHYLGEDADRSQTSPYAAPARASDFSRLPPAFIQTNGLDPLRDEGINYAQSLMAAGVDVELYNCPGAYHGAPSKDPRTALLAYQLYNAAIGAALNPDQSTGGL